MLNDYDHLSAIDPSNAVVDDSTCMEVSHDCIVPKMKWKSWINNWESFM